MNELHFLGADQCVHVIICVSVAAELVGSERRERVYYLMAAGSAPLVCCCDHSVAKIVCEHFVPTGLRRFSRKLFYYHGQDQHTDGALFGCGEG